MAWDDFVCRVHCAVCDKTFRVRFNNLWKAGNVWICSECGSRVELPPPPMPNLPPVLYAGPERLKRIKITPLPPSDVIYEGIGEYHQWYGAGDCSYCPFARRLPDSYGAPADCGFNRPPQIQPYSIRSFLTQLSMRKDFPCKYFVCVHGTDEFGNTLWEEGCMDHCGGCDYHGYLHPCNVVNGWMHGDQNCAGWEYIKQLCQSENEVRFLQQYLRTNHDREYPMPIPQAYVEVKETVRVDFVLFVPITRFDWKWWAIEIDSKEYHANTDKDFKKNVTLASAGYEIIRLSAEKKMLDQVRELYAKVTEVQTAGQSLRSV